MNKNIESWIRAFIASTTLCILAFPAHAQHKSINTHTVDSVVSCDNNTFLLKTNLIADALACPHIGAEWLWKGRFGIAADYTFGRMGTTSDLNYNSLHLLHAEARWYPFKPKQVDPSKLERSHHFGVYAMLSTYDFMIDGVGYQAKPWMDTWGVGLSYGYRWNLNRWWSLDFTIGAGYSSTSHTLYERYRNWYVRTGYAKRHWFGISKAEISLVWNINSLKYEKKK